MQLEFSTIPPYLCAQWSINADPSGVSGMIGNIVLQEMYHFALAGNILTAIGGVPNIANAAFIQKTLVQDTAGHWSFKGAAIQFPTWFNFQQSTVTPSPSLAFNQAFSQLLIGLQACWKSGARPNISAVFNLQNLGVGLIKPGIRPEFLWAPAA